jgi:hypothetical protein
MNRNEWNGRPVTFGDFDIKQGRAVREAFREDGEAALYLGLAASLRYADSGELVFQSVDEVWAQPNRLSERIFYLASEALTANGFATGRPPAGAPKPNGHDPEPPRPSL